MQLRIPTRWIVLLFILSLTSTWIACSKEQSFEKNRSQPVRGNGGDSTGNGGGGNGSGDSTSNNGGDTVTTGGDSTGVSDVDFMMQVTYFNRAQVDNGTLANDQGTAQSVRDFGGAMVTRFREALTDADKVAAQMTINLPTKTDASHQAVTDGLKGMSGKTFDVSYIDYQIRELQRTVDMFVAQINNGQDSRVKTYAEKYLPYLRDYLQTASTIRQTL